MRGTGVGLFFRLLLEPEHSQTRLPTGMGRSQVCECMNHDKKFHELSGIIDTWDSATEKPVHGKLVPGFGGRGRGQTPTRPTQPPIRLLFETRGGRVRPGPTQRGSGVPPPHTGGTQKNWGPKKFIPPRGGPTLEKNTAPHSPHKYNKIPLSPRYAIPIPKSAPGRTTLAKTEDGPHFSGKRSVTTSLNIRDDHHRGTKPLTKTLRKSNDVKATLLGNGISVCISC